MKSDVEYIYATKTSFSALKKDKSVVYWGKYYDTSSDLRDIEKIFSNQGAFAALKTDGSVICYGDPYCGGNYTVNISNVINIFTTSNGFTAMTKDDKFEYCAHETIISAAELPKNDIKFTSIFF